MQLVSLSFQNYKAFRSAETIEIRPLTVLIGKNSSGKSAVARLPMLLSAAMSDKAEAPLPLEGDGVDFGGTFVELIHNQQPHGAVAIGATFEEGGERFELNARVQNYEEAKLPVLDRLDLHFPDKKHHTFEYIDKNPIYRPHHYRVSLAGHEPVDLPLSIGGIRPDLSEVFYDEAKPASLRQDLFVVATVLAGMERFLSRTGYLGPFRPEPQRFYRDPGNVLQNVGRGGKLAAALLGSDALRMKGGVLRAVSDWYKDHLGGWPLDVVWSGSTFSLVVRKPDAPDVAVSLADVGAGLAQVLPLIVQRQLENLSGSRSALEIVEQPELHLHPGVHPDVADLYIEAAKHPGARFLVETHSENFVLRIRRRVAEHHRDPTKGLDPRLVQLYSIEPAEGGGSSVKPIEILPDGEVSYWPEGVFSEAFEEVCAIREAQGMEAP